MKKSRKRTTKSRSESRTRGKYMPYVWAAIAAVVVLALIIVLIISSRNKDASLATVNGEPITQEELDFQYNLLPPTYQQTFTRDQVLEQIIDEELVVQAAREQGITVNDEQVLQRIQAIIAENQISIAEFQENLAQYNVTEAQFEELIRRQQLIEAYLNTTMEQTTPDEETIQALYDVSKSQFTIDEQVTVRHVLISNQRDDAAVLAKQVYDEAQAGADFCTLVANYSDDRGSRENCGEYTFPRGFMDPVFENTSFGIADGEIALAQTQFGYHIIKRINITPERVQQLDEVRDQLEAQYLAADRSMQYRKLISTLRSQATIVYANGTKLLPEQPNTISPTGNVVEEPVAEPTETTETPAEPALNETPEVPTEAPEVPVEAPNETQIPEEPAQEPVQPTEQSSDELLSCIAAKATLYGASWSTDTQDAIRLFERQNVPLKYFACDNGCDGIKAYPTWVINDEQYLGRMTIEQLKNAANC